MVKKEGPVIRPWTEADLEGVFQLVDRENWGWELDEIKRIHKLDPSSSVIAEEAGELRGLVTVINYGLMAYMVHVIVEGGCRRTGLGKTMVKAAVERLDAENVSRIELHAMPDVLGFYRQLGFQVADSVDFYSLDPTPRDAENKGRQSDRGKVALLGRRDYGDLSRLIARSMDVDAGDVARSLKTDPPEVVAGLVIGGRLKGALVGKVGFKLNGIGPWVMEEFDDVSAQEMLRKVISRLPPKRTDVLIPSANGDSRRAIESEGFRLVKGGLVRAIRPAERASAYPPGLLAVGHFGIV